MARITVEDCLEKINNHFRLVQVASHRARQLQSGTAALINIDKRHKVTVTALREIAGGEIDESVLDEPMLESFPTQPEKGMGTLANGGLGIQSGMAAVLGGGGLHGKNAGIEEGEAGHITLPEGTEGTGTAGISGSGAECEMADEADRNIGVGEADYAGVTAMLNDYSHETTVSLESLHDEGNDQVHAGGNDEVPAQTAQEMEDMANLALDKVSQTDCDEKENE